MSIYHQNQFAISVEGSYGVGKTAIAEALAVMLIENDVSTRIYTKPYEERRNREGKNRLKNILEPDDEYLRDSKIITKVLIFDCEANTDWEFDEEDKREENIYKVQIKNPKRP